ncbi:MAG: hypothetical protein SGI73_07630 [Chloroflexota bacterium]|nr:hypothetical protein [Chloroflexota bacterium]
MRRLLRFLTRLIRFALLCALIALIPSSTLLLSDPWRAVGVIVGARHFDYIGWELRALAAKADATLFGAHPFMTEADRAAFVRAYMDDLTRAGRLDGDIAAIYADPAVDDPDDVSAALRAERDSLRADLAARQTLTESILEGQVAAVLVEQGFGVAGQLLPPIAMRFTETPQLLVVSPRAEITFDIGFNLNPLTVDAAAALEAQVDAALGVSSLIVPIGGLALYPAMILERSSIPSALETFAHEWLHHYLYFFPLGLSYDFAGEARIINETTANLFGQEVGRLVAERYYPEVAARAIPQRIAFNQSQPFDFGAALDETRRTVDVLLAAGRIDDAEAYMEERRALFVANGYGIRKLNQAFFAFYGGYQAGTPGAGGSDPIGGAVAALRDASPSLRAWIEALRGITTRADLLAAAARVGFEAAG